jgi:hypothetical protein
MIQNGYPCVHQMAMIIHVDQLPAIGYSNPRWFTSAPAVRQRDQEDDVWTQDDMANDEDIDAVSQADGIEQSMAEVHDWDIDRTLEELPAMSTRSAYLTLFHFAKGICGMAARDHERSCRLPRVLQELRAEMTTLLVEAGEPNEHVRDISDAVARRRGRPKKREIPNATMRAAKTRKGAEMIISCDLCDGAYELNRCLDIDIVLGARVQNGPLIPETGQRKCGLCWGYGHQKRTCHAVGNSKHEKTSGVLRLGMATKPRTNAENFD